jgi:hypothetical protein
MEPKRLNRSGRGSKKTPRGAVLIYDQIEEIKATKGRGSNWPGEKFVHKFTKGKGKIYGLPSGALLIVAPYPLWDMFDYPDE